MAKEANGDENAEKGKKDKHFSERGIIMQPFSRVIMGCRAVRFLTD